MTEVADYESRPELTAIRHVLDMTNAQYMATFMKIRTKEKGIQPLILNRGQLYIDAMAEEQLALRDRVRIILLKARQWGGSTYIQARTYRRITQNKRGWRAMIVAHKATATANIFGMTTRFHNHMDPRFRPYSRGAGLHKLVFPKRDSSYTVATAGGKSIGHSDTVQIFHGSETALWPNADDAMTGVLNTVPEGGGSEVWQESTGNGMGNAFHTQFSNARKGIGDYKAAFVPWHWFPDYERDPAEVQGGMMLSPDDEEFMLLHGLTERQMAFRALKILTLGGGERGEIAFAQQFPITPEEAFSSNVIGSFIGAKYVMRARRNAGKVQPYGLRLMGIDPAWRGNDRFTIKMRQGRKAWHVAAWQHERTIASVGKCMVHIKRERPHIIFVDANGVGAGVVDQLEDLCRPLGIMVIIVMGAESPDDEVRYPNKRQECWGRMLEWYQMSQPVSIEDTDEERLDAWQGDTTNPLVDYDAAGRQIVESKKKMSLPGRNMPSPDHADALSETFAFEIGFEQYNEWLKGLTGGEDRAAVDARYA